MNFYEDLPYRVQSMQLDDIDEVMAIEYRSFSSPWSVRAYRYELTANAYSQFVVVRQAMPATPATEILGLLDRLLRSPPRTVKPPVLGHGGFWLLVDEAHISTIAVAPEWRGMGLGELVLVGLLDRAIMVQAEVATLEVRMSNRVAQNLYQKYLFHTLGVRKGYYSGNQEDALVMTTDPLRSVAFRETFQRNREALAGSLKQKTQRPQSDRADSQMG